MKISSVKPAGYSYPSTTFLGKKDSPQTYNKENQHKKTKLKKVLPYMAAAVSAAVGIGVGYLIASKKQNIQSQSIQDALQKTSKPSQDAAQKTKNSDKLWLSIAALAGMTGYGAGKITNEDKDDIVEKISKGDTPLQRASYTSADEIDKIKSTHINSTLDKYTKDFYGLTLLNQNNVSNRNAGKYKDAIENIQEIGYEKLTSNTPLAPVEKNHPVIWSVTSEFAPVKEGGLGSVPPEVRNNAQKLGVDMPTFIPMYLNDGNASFTKDGDRYIYKYKKNEFNLEKMISFKMDTFKNGKIQSVPVELYLNRQGNNKLIFIKCDSYFDGTIYETNTKTEESEKFAVMSKAVYEFAKAKSVDGVSTLKDAELFSYDALCEVPFPDGMLLNDWQASPIAALARYKAPMENAHGQLSDESAKMLHDMRIITIGHNVMYQGTSWLNNNPAQRRLTTNNILNTLFDEYTYDIVSNAKTHVERIDDKDEQLKNLDNPLLMHYQDRNQNSTNFLNMGIVLSDYFAPVSQNYADELISPKHPDLSYSLQWALIQKAQAGKLKGIINGNDYSNLNIHAKDKQIKNLTGLDFEKYSKNDSIETIQEARKNNKINLYNNYILPFSCSNSTSPEKQEAAGNINQRLEFYSGDKGTDLPVLSDKELEDTPIFTSGGRLVSQKGIDVLCDSIKLLYDNWDKDFPDKPKPIFYIAGADGEGGIQRAYIEKLKNEDLSKEDNDRVLFAHGFAPMAAMMAGSDYFLMPSKFEPCGLTQGESFALATPVIASAVGGIVDTLNRDGKHNGILTDKDKELDAQGFYQAIKEGLNIFFNDKNQYNEMVKDSLDEDFSWIKHGKKGPVYDYLELFGIDKNKLSDVS